MDSERRERPIAVVAMGGHAFIAKGEKGTAADHLRNADAIGAALMALVERDYNLVITHGNGPQVGNLLLATELTRDQLTPFPLDVLVAQTEGSLGYILQQALLNHLRRREIHRFVLTVITQVLVDAKDEAFRRPTKPIGPFLTQGEAEARRDALGWNIVEDSGRGWRRVVASPRPLKVVQRHTIRDAAREGHIVIAGGGGGIPIVKDDADNYVGVEAVIDKDLTSAVLASQIGADLLIILTAVPNVYINFGRPDQRALGAVTLDEVSRLVEARTFPAGSMGPKVEAIHDFLRAGGKRGLITDPPSLGDALEGKAGTHFVGRI